LSAATSSARDVTGSGAADAFTPSAAWRLCRWIAVRRRGGAGSSRRFPLASAQRVGVFLSLSALAALLSPNGIDLFTLPLRMLRMSFATSGLSEWSAADFHNFQPLEIWIVLAILGGLCLGLGVPWTRTAMLLLPLHLALTHVRNAELLGIIGPLLIAAPLAAQLKGPAPVRPSSAASGAPRGLSAAPLAPAVTIVIALAVMSTALCQVGARLCRRLRRRSPQETAGVGNLRSRRRRRQVRLTIFISRCARRHQFFQRETALAPLTSLAKHNEPHAEKTQPATNGAVASFAANGTINARQQPDCRSRPDKTD
jgi:hypothetical protein